MSYVRATQRRAQNFRSTHMAIVLAWRHANQHHTPESVCFKTCHDLIERADVTNYDRTRLHAALYALREYSVMTHARWQLYIDGKPVRSEEISAMREAGDEEAWLRVCGRHEYDESHDPYYEDKAPEYLHSNKRHCNDYGQVIDPIDLNKGV